MTYDTIIVGAGIAGVSAALALCREEKVLVVEAESPAAGASGVAGGLFSPMLALRGRPIWRMSEAIDAFYRQLEDTDGQALFDKRGVLRPADDEQQATYFKQSVARLPEEAEWLPPGISKDRFQTVNAPYGSMYVHRAGAVDLAAYVHHLAQSARQRGVEIRMHTRVHAWGDLQEGGAFIEIEPKKGPSLRIEAERVILCWGRSFTRLPEFAHLNLHEIKGQTIRVTYPESLTFNDLIPTSGKGYIIPQHDHVAIGSSFEHTFSSDESSPAISKALLQKAQQMVPALKESRIIDAQVGFRVSVPGYRMPIVGPLPGYSSVFVFSAFGSKGLLLAPLLAHELPNYLAGTLQIPAELHPRVKS